jgi:hypothetical protein
MWNHHRLKHLAFQAWRALLAALLRLELDRLVRIAKSDKERRWLRERAAPGVPTSRTKTLSQMLEESGRPGVSLGTALALELHDYQYNGPDPDTAVSKYRNREEATVDVRLLVKGLAKRVEELKSRVKWYDELENTLKKVVEALGGKQ